MESFSHVDHYAKYNYLEYELFRNNKPIGFHKYIFNRNNGNLIIDSEVSFKITKLGVDLYRYYATGKERYKNGFYTFNDKSIFFKERLFFRKIKLNRKLDRKSLKLTTLNNNRFVSNHNCSITNIADYKNKIFENITKLKETWKNNYKDNKM